MGLVDKLATSRGQLSNPAVKNTLMYILSLDKSWHVHGLQ